MSEKTRVMFIGEMVSTHAQSWIRLVASHCDDFSVIALNISPWGTWEDAPIEVYSPLIDSELLNNAHFNFVQDMHCQEWHHYIPKDQLLVESQIKYAKKIIDDFCPHVIHTFGFFPSAVFFWHVLEYARPDWCARWVLQTRGGSDFSTPYRDLHWKECYNRIIPVADALICDNLRNFSILDELKISHKRHPALSLAPGTGGMLMPETSFAAIKDRERVILWPKAYDSSFAMALPIFEGIRAALPLISPVHILCTSVAPVVRDAIRSLSDNERDCFSMLEHIPREHYLALYADSRVMLAPSLVDGIPNVLYEAMIAGLVPIVSPLETLTPHFEDGKQLLYARNLYPNEIAEALIKAMNDDALAEHITCYNAKHFPFFARRPDIQRKLRELYLDLAGKINPLQTDLGQARAQLIHTKHELEDVQKEFEKVQEELSAAKRALSHPVIRMQRKLWRFTKFWK